MTRMFTLAILCWGTVGCTVFQPVADIGNRFPDECKGVAESVVSQTALGSQVEIVCQHGESSETYVGTVIHASPDGAVLVNCVETGRSSHRPPAWLRLPYVNRMFKNSGVGAQRVPVQWVSRRKMTTLRVIAAPPAGYVAPQLESVPSDDSSSDRMGIDFDFDERDNRVILRNSKPVKTPTPRL